MRSTTLSFTRSAERFILEAFFGERRGIVANLVCYQVVLLSKVFTLFVKVRRFLFGRECLPIKSSLWYVSGDERYRGN